MEHDLPAWGDLADCEILVRIPDVDDSIERLACRRVEKNDYEVCCLPFSLYEVCLGDTIRLATPMLGQPGHISEKVADGRRYLFRVSLVQPSRVNMQSAASSLISMGHLVEVYSDMLISVDAADHDAAKSLAAYLQMQEDAGEWQYETGRLHDVAGDA